MCVHLGEAYFGEGGAGEGNDTADSPRRAVQDQRTPQARTGKVGTGERGLQSSET